MQGFYGELFYEYIIALNYKIRLEKFLIKLANELKICISFFVF